MIQQITIRKILSLPLLLLALGLPAMAETPPSKKASCDSCGSTSGELHALTETVTTEKDPAEPSAIRAPLAVVDGVAITPEEIEKALGPQLNKLQEQIYNLKLQKVEAIIKEKLLAKEAAKRGISIQALLDAEVTSKVSLVTEQEIELFYQANKSGIQGEETSVRQQIRAHIQNQKLANARETFVHSLRSEATIVILLKPTIYRLEVPVEGAPFRGAEKAPLTIVELSDYYCPSCKRVQATLTQVLSEYSDRAKLVYRDFPIDSLHPGARKAAEAARCADDQGKFWEYHDKLFASVPDATPEKFTALAKEVGLDLPAFRECLETRKHQAAVQKDVDLGSRLGVTGTPSFFINGRMLSGAQPYDNFAKLLDEELARSRPELPPQDPK